MDLAVLDGVLHRPNDRGLPDDLVEGLGAVAAVERGHSANPRDAGRRGNNWPASPAYLTRRVDLRSPPLISWTVHPPSKAAPRRVSCGSAPARLARGARR